MTPDERQVADGVEHFDVLVVGAGLSGIGAGWHLKHRCPERTWAILEMRDAIGGTWDLFRYPGIRSDSDMYTLGYRFRPWRNPKAIADGPSILEYIRETAREEGIDRRIRYRHKVVHAAWSSAASRWTITVEVGDAGRRGRFSCNFLWLCSGYYDYDRGYAPEWPGGGRFRGPIVHPQHWPEGLDYAGKRVVVIGSGATAVTLVPAMATGAGAAAHVTMLQRSPSYVVSRPSRDRIADALRRVLPERAAYALTRWKNVFIQLFFFNLARRRPTLVKRAIMKAARKELGADFDVDTHFNPPYRPWDQRLCLVPDSDLFEVLRAGTASIVTDHIESFTERGIRLASGRELEADVIVTATGLVLKVMAGYSLEVDGEAVALPRTLTYKGSMLSDVPNLVTAFGYTNASWTLKCDLTAEFACRLLNHMRAHGFTQATPRRTDPTLEEEPVLDFNSGYVLRALDRLPRQGSKPPWRLWQNYAKDLRMLRYGRIEDEALEFGRNGAGTGGAMGTPGSR